MSDHPKPFEGWAILELVDHRRLGGYVRETRLAGSAVLQLNVPGPCTGISASWCPSCGDCACPTDGSGNYPAKDDPDCPLHAPDSPHGDQSAPQFFTMGAITALLPCCKEEAEAATLRPSQEQHR